MTSSKTLLITLLVLGLLLTVGLYLSGSQSEPQVPADTSPVPQTDDENLATHTTDSGYTFQLPNDPSSPYVTMTDWPPALQVLIEPLECTEAGAPEDRAGATQEKTIEGRVFCVTEVAEGAAGSIYHQYAYTTDIDGATFVYTFSVRMPQCHNYDAPESEQCAEAQQSFDPDIIAAVLADTTKPQSRPNSFQWSCPSGDQFRVTYTGENNHNAVLELPGEETPHALTVARSGSGARYANADESVVFWEHQGEARIEVNGETAYEACVVGEVEVRATP